MWLYSEKRSKDDWTNLIVDKSNRKNKNMNEEVKAFKDMDQECAFTYILE